jgi:hypothetical protein
MTEEISMMSETSAEEQSRTPVENTACDLSAATDEREMPCPVCGARMPDLKGGKASICPNCGFKDSCCY